MKHRILTATLCLALGLSQALAQDIAGTYYGSKDMAGIGKTNVFKIEYNADEHSISVSYDGGSAPVKGYPHENAVKAVQSGELYTFTLTAFGPRHINRVTLIQIEPGVFVVDPATRTDIGCTETTRSTAAAGAKGGKVYENESIQREYIIGKDENRVKALVANKTEYEKLIADAVMKRCKVISGDFGSKNPLPAEGMRDAALKTEVLALVKAWATQKSWPETVQRAFVKSADWTILRHATTGVITGREIVCVVLHSKATACSWREFTVRQEYTGSAYGKSFIAGASQASYPTDCN